MKKNVLIQHVKSVKQAMERSALHPNRLVKETLLIC